MGPGRSIYGWPSGFGRGILTLLPQIVVDAWFQHPEKERERLFRAIVQYHHAIQNWTPGSEIAALSHIWIGMESLTKLIRAKRAAELGLDLRHLTELYATERAAETGKKITFKSLNIFDGEIRRRHLFKGDDVVYKHAMAASDAYEHSFSPLWEVREQAVQVVETAGAYLREAIFDLFGLDDEVKSLLLSPQFNRPYNDWMDTTLHGELSGHGVAIESIEGYPEIEVFSEHIQIGVDPEKDAAIGLRTRIAASNLPLEVSFKPLGVSIAAPPSVTEGTGVLTSQSEAELTNSDMTAWKETVDRGRPCHRFRSMPCSVNQSIPDGQAGSRLTHRWSIVSKPPRCRRKAWIMQIYCGRQSGCGKSAASVDGSQCACSPGPDENSVAILYRRELPQI